MDPLTRARWKVSATCFALILIGISSELDRSGTGEWWQWSIAAGQLVVSPFIIWPFSTLAILTYRRVLVGLFGTIFLLGTLVVALGVWLIGWPSNGGWGIAGVIVAGIAAGLFAFDPDVRAAHAALGWTLSKQPTGRR